MTRKDNSILVEFDFLVDLDLAMFKFMKDKFSESPLLNRDIIDDMDEQSVIFKLLNRKYMNPLEIILDNSVEVTNLYYEIMDDYYQELLCYAKAYDTFGLMITFLNNASSVDITVLCKNKIEEEFIKDLNPILNTIIIPNRRDVPLNNYTAIYLKYFVNIVEYRNVAGKHIYIAAAKFNMEEDRDMVNTTLCGLYSDINIIHLIDLYTKVKYRFRKKDSEDD